MKLTDAMAAIAKANCNIKGAKRQLWLLRRSTRIETGLLQIQAELMRGRKSASRRNVRKPEWYDEVDVAASRNATALVPEHEEDAQPQADRSEALAYCYLQVGRLQFGSFDTLSRYETSLWRQAAQLMFLLQSAARH